MDKERIYIIITLIITLLVALLGIFLGKSFDLYAKYIIPILLLLLLYLLMASQSIKMEKNIFDKIKSISYNYEFITGENAVKRTLLEAIKETREAIFATGGRAREGSYLNVLTQKVVKEKVKYYRVILGNNIHIPFYNHLNKILENKLPNVHIGYLEEEKFGNMLVTDNKVIFYIPSATSNGLDSVLKIDDSYLAISYQRYIIDVFLGSQLIRSKADLNKLYNNLKRK